MKPYQLLTSKVVNTIEEAVFFNYEQGFKKSWRRSTVMLCRNYRHSAWRCLIGKHTERISKYSGNATRFWKNYVPLAHLEQWDSSKNGRSSHLSINRYMDLWTLVKNRVWWFCYCLWGSKFRIVDEGNGRWWIYTQTFDDTALKKSPCGHDGWVLNYEGLSGL